MGKEKKAVPLRTKLVRLGLFFGIIFLLIASVLLIPVNPESQFEFLKGHRPALSTTGGVQTARSGASRLVRSTQYDLDLDELQVEKMVDAELTAKGWTVARRYPGLLDLTKAGDTVLVMTQKSEVVAVSPRTPGEMGVEKGSGKGTRVITVLGLSWPQFFSMRLRAIFSSEKTQ